MSDVSWVTTLKYSLKLHQRSPRLRVSPSPCPLSPRLYFPHSSAANSFPLLIRRFTQCQRDSLVQFQFAPLFISGREGVF